MMKQTKSEIVEFYSIEEKELLKKSINNLVTE